MAEQLERRGIKNTADWLKAFEPPKIIKSEARAKDDAPDISVSFAVFPVNWKAVSEVWMRVATSIDWKGDYPLPKRVDRQTLWQVIDALESRKKKRLELFDQIMLIERAAIDDLNVFMTAYYRTQRKKRP